MIDAPEFEQLTPHLPRARRAEVLPPLQAAMAKFGINTALREAHAMAQFLHESGSFIFKRELASGAAYEGRRDLGNTQPGDGVRFKGRGWIQVTGRHNYRKFGSILGIDLEHNPTLAETDANAALIACAFWGDRKLNQLADKDELITITRRINGGTNGLADRRAKLILAKKVLSTNDVEDTEDPEEPFRVDIRGTTASNEAFMDDENRLWIPLRPVTNLLGIGITDIQGDNALLDSKGQQVSVPFDTRGNTGFTRARDFSDALKLNLEFLGKEKLVKLS